MPLKHIINKKHPSKSKIWYLIASVLILIMLLISGQIKISVWNLELENTSLENRNYTFNLSWIQNITGDIAISPHNSFDMYQKHLSTHSQDTKNTKNAKNIKNIKNIKLYTYDFTEKNIKEKFKHLLSWWTTIKLIMENYKYKQYKNTWQHIKEYFSHSSGFQLHSDKGLGTQYQHAKVTLLDNTFAIHTANLTKSSFFKNREYWFWSNNKAVLSSLNTIFDKDRQQQNISPKDIHPNILICPLNCRNGVETLLQSAKESIIMQEQYLADDRVINILKNKAVDPNIDIKITLASPSKNYTRAKYFWTHIVRVVKKPYIHAKMILIDKKYLLLGSMNISETSLNKNREIGIIITDKKSIQKFLTQFKEDRKNAEK